MDQVLTTAIERLEIELDKCIDECNVYAKMLKKSEEKCLHYKTLIAELENIKNGLCKND